MSSADSANLLLLVDLITNAVNVVVNEYAAVNQPVPSLESTVPGPFDTPEATSPQLSKAIQIIEAACPQLSFTVASPGHVMTNVSINSYDSSYNFAEVMFHFRKHWR